MVEKKETSKRNDFLFLTVWFGTSYYVCNVCWDIGMDISPER